MGVIKRQGLKNTVSSYLGIMIGFVNLIIIQPYFLTKEELGLTRVLYSFALLVSVFVPLGIGNATTRFFPQFKNEEKRHYGYFGFMLLFPLAGYLLSVVALYLLKDFIFSQYVKESPLFTEFFNYVFPLIFCLSFINVLSIYCFSNYKSTIPSYLNDIVVRILTIAVVSLYYLKWFNLDQFITAFVGIYAIQLLTLLCYIFWFDKPGFKIDKSHFRLQKIDKLIGYSFLLWLAGVAAIGLKYFDALMIGKYMPLSFVGIYTVAAFIPTIVEAPLNAFEKIAASRIAFAWKDNNMEEIRTIYRKSSLYLFIFGGFLFLNVNLNISDLLSFLPAGYEEGGTVVLILSTATLFNMATGLNAPILFNSERYRTGALFLVILAVVAVGLQMFFIPLLGMNGAAVATGLSSVIYNSLLFWYVLRHFHLQPFGKENLQVALSIILLLTGGYLLPDLSNRFISIAFKSSVVSLLYIVIIYRLGVAREIIDLLPEKFRKRQP
jgi:O-antigen/teichoic acid export membrane protein